MRRSTLLITGFGPFPDVPVNASATLARRLAAAARRHFNSIDVVSSVLPTDWTRAPDRLAALYARHTPAVALHFGVSSRATGLELERLAVNRCATRPDAAGALPGMSRIVEDGPDSLQTSLPVGRILKRLAAADIAASHSDDAGSYLCNALLYHAARQVAAGSCGMAGFVHIPVDLPDIRGASSALTLGDAVAGGLAIIDVCLNPLETSASRSAPPGHKRRLRR